MLLAFLLIVQLGVLYVAVSDIRLPESVVARMVKSLEKEGLKCSAEEVRLRNLTVLTAKEVRADLLTGGDPLLSVRRCAVKLTPSGLISGNFIPEFVYVDGAKLYCPSINSSSGLAEELITDGALLAQRNDGVIKISAARCRLRNAPIVAWGTIPGTRTFFEGDREDESLFPVKKSSASAEKISAVISRFSGALSSALRERFLTTFLDSGSFSAEFEMRGNSAAARLSACWDEIDFREDLVLKDVWGTQTVLISPGAKCISPDGAFRLFAEDVAFSRGENFSERIWVHAKNADAAGVLPKAIFSGTDDFMSYVPDEIFLRFEKISARNLTLGEFAPECVLLKIASSEKPFNPENLEVEANLWFGDSEFALDGRLTLSATPTLDLQYEFSFDKDSLAAFPQMHFLFQNEDFKTLRFAEFPRVFGRVRFTEGMVFERAIFEITSGNTRVGTLDFEDLCFAGIVTPELFRLEKIRARGKDFLANADIYSEFADGGAFRVRAWGSVDPSYIDDRLGWFWSRIWRDVKIAPGAKSPRADIDVHGHWGNRWENVFGTIACEDCYANGILVDQVRLRVYEDPFLIAAFDMGFLRGENFASGCLQWHYKAEPTYHYRDFRFLFEGSFPPKDVLQIVGEGLPEALDELSADGAGTATVRGFLSGTPLYYEDRILVNIDGQLPGKFSIFGISGEDFCGKIFYDNGEIFVGSPFTARVGNGEIAGDVHVILPKNASGKEGTDVKLSLDLNRIPRARLLDMLSAVGSRVEGAKSIEDVPEAFVAAEDSAGPEDDALLSGTFFGEMILPNIQSLNASGTIFAEDEDLFELQAFGGVSRLLSTLKIDLTTFPLNRAEGSYRVRDGIVFLPDLRIFGESGEINVQADVFLSDLSIRGEAVFRNLRGTRIPLLGRLIAWGSSPTELLPVSISGTIKEPEWKIAPKISRIWSSPEKKFGVVPEEKTESLPENTDAPGK